MMAIPFKKVGGVLLTLGLVAFLMIGFFGFSHSSMAMGEDGNMTMSNCPFMSGQAAVCNMDPLEHIAAWQSMFTSIPSQTGSTLILMLLAALALAFLWTHLWRPPIDCTYTPSRFFVRRDYIPPVSPLQELFSSGILNPKLF